MAKENIGYITQQPNGTWKAVIEYPMVNGKRRRKSRVCPTESKAKKALMELNIERKAYIDKGEHLIQRLSFEKAVEVFKTRIQMKVSVGLLKKKTQLCYITLADKLCKDFGSYDCFSGDLNAEVFEGYLKDFHPKKKPNSHVRPLSEKEQGLIDDYIKETLSQHIGNKKRQWLIIFLYYFALHTGCRCGEIAGLKWSAIREDEGIILIENNLIYIPGEGLLDDTPKTYESARRLVVSQSVFKLLNRLKKTYLMYDYPISEYCFINRDGRPLFPRNILRDFQEMCKRAGLTNHHTFHDIRHTNITTKIIKGVDVKTVSLMAGHSSTNVTLNTYSHFWREAAQKAANIMEGKMVCF